MHYKKLNDEIQRRYNEFPMKFAFSDEQLKKGLAELGCSDVSEVVSIGGGGFIRRSDVDAFNTMARECANLHDTSIANDDEYVETMFYYELGNHEYCVTMDIEDALDACNLTADEVNNDPRLRKLLAAALKRYEQDCSDWF